MCWSPSQALDKTTRTASAVREGLALLSATRRACRRRGIRAQVVPAVRLARPERPTDGPVRVVAPRQQLAFAAEPARVSGSRALEPGRTLMATTCRSRGPPCNPLHPLPGEVRGSCTSRDLNPSRAPHESRPGFGQVLWLDRSFRRRVHVGRPPCPCAGLAATSRETASCSAVKQPRPGHQGLQVVSWQSAGSD